MGIIEQSQQNAINKQKAEQLDTRKSAEANTAAVKNQLNREVENTINQSFVNRYRPSLEDAAMQDYADQSALAAGVQPSQDGFAQAARLRKDYEPNSFLDEVQDRISKLWDASGIPAGFDRFQNLDMINNQTPEEADRIRKIAEADRFMQQQYPNQ